MIWRKHKPTTSLSSSAWAGYLGLPCGYDDCARLPGPRDQLERGSTQDLGGLLLSVLQPMSEMKQGREGQLDEARHRARIVLQAGRWRC
jgi:hypothetical protein